MVWRHICGALGIDVEHDKADKAVKMRHTLHTFQCVVQTVRLCSGWVDPDTDQRTGSRSTENIPVFGIKIRNVEPFFPVIGYLGRRLQSVFKAQDPGFDSRSDRNMLHLKPPANKVLLTRVYHIRGHSGTTEDDKKCLRFIYGCDILACARGTGTVAGTNVLNCRS
mgnify:CR=1 FL=1